MGKQRTPAGNPGCPAYIHGCAAEEKLKDCLRIMNELTNQYSFQAAASAMEWHVPEGTSIFVMHRYWLPDHRIWDHYSSRDRSIIGYL